MKVSLKLVVVSLVAVGVVGIPIYILMNKYASDRRTVEVEKTADILAKPVTAFPHGMMTKADYKEYDQLLVQVTHGKPLSDAESADLINMLTHRPPHDQESFDMLMSSAIDVFRHDEHLTNSQRSKIYDATLPWLSVEDQFSFDRSGADKLAACEMMYTLGDKRAIPAILPLLNDKRSDIRRNAAKTLQHLGYMIPQSAAG